ncbi:MAG: cobalt ECF transporter T component CbiQ [Betaproteobacteria bacterium]|nr:cobalt ECF transporter T component CbiQ [Betaproteobacteria bacterium]
MSPIEAALRDLRSLDTLAVRDTPLSHVDARAKIVTTLAFIVAVVSFDRYTIAALLPFALYPAVLAALGDVPARWLLRKLAIAAPFAVAVGLFNPLLDREPVMALGATAIAGGWVSFGSILLRFALTVTAALAVVAGTGMHTLCAALGRIGAPRIFVAQLLFLYRYAFVLGGEASRMGTARMLRGGTGSPALAVYGSLAGHLLLRAFGRAERIHQAMLARGFDGEVRAMRVLEWKAADTHFVAGWCAWFALARAVDLPQLLGHALTGALA